MSVYYNAYVDRLWSTAGLPAVELGNGSFSRRPSVFVPDLIANTVTPAEVTSLVQAFNNDSNVTFGSTIPIGSDVTDVTVALVAGLPTLVGLLNSLNASQASLTGLTGATIQAQTSNASTGQALALRILTWAKANSAGTPVQIVAGGGSWTTLSQFATAQGIP